MAAVLNNKVSRRGFFAGTAGLAGAGIVLAACGSSSKNDSGATTSTTSAKGGTDMSGDLKIAGVAAGLEVLAVGTYKAALDAATAGKLGTVPPAVAAFVTKAMADHQAHLDAWNKVLTGAGQPAVTAPNATLKPTVDAAFAKVTDAGGAATLALMLEQIAAQTYLKVIPTLAGKDAIKLAGSIQIIDQQHQAILLYALGQYPVPDVFQGTDKAAA
jgi:hypothetical protein